MLGNDAVLSSILRSTSITVPGEKNAHTVVMAAATVTIELNHVQIDLIGITIDLS